MRVIDRFTLLLATGLGVGRLPGSPGTYGSLWGVAIAAGLQSLHLSTTQQAVALAALIACGVPICGRAAKLLGLKDPGPVVYDEYAALPLVYLFADWSWLTAAAGFALFRLFDITKPWPVRRLERLPDGWGIMADDVAAALLAGGLLMIGLRMTDAF